MNHRRLVLHIGVTKTGSSAIQAGLVQNRERLAEHGIGYPASRSDRRALRWDTTSGNGMLLVPFLAPRERDSDAASLALGSVLEELDRADTPTLLYSSEALFRFEAAALRHFHRELQSRDVQLHAAAFVRDISGHAWSAYLQMVKRRMYAGTFSDFLAGTTTRKAYNPRIRGKLKFLNALLGKENVSVLHYDSLRDRIFEGFLETVFGVHVDQGWARSDRRVNRSLTLRELAYTQFLNTIVDDPQTARSLNDALLAHRPIGESGHGVTRENIEALEAKFGDDVAWVNDVFFGGPVLQVDSLDASKFRSPVSLSHLEEAVLRAMATLTPSDPSSQAGAVTV